MLLLLDHYHFIGSVYIKKKNPRRHLFCSQCDSLQRGTYLLARLILQ